NRVDQALPGKTRTETGILQCLHDHPESMVVIGNAPTALLATCQAIQATTADPCLIVGAPVGFVSVLESKELLEHTSVPQIRVEGRKGGSAVAAAIVNALFVLAWQRR
ncbi:MAG: precorrin-8X methylmutase, partial [Cyanobacteria bacterium P01_A01_bin.37]